MSRDRCYLTLLRYPPDLTGRQRTLALSEGLGVDEYTASMLQKLTPPAVVKTCAGEAGAEAVARLRELGIDAAAIAREEIERFSARTDAKRLLSAIGALRPMYAIEPLRPRLATVSALVMDDVAMIVFGRIRQMKVRTVREPLLEFEEEMWRQAGYEAVGISGSASPQVTTARSGPDAHAFVIDLYTMRGECVRVDSDTCGYDFLGEERGLTDRDNVAKAMERFRAEAERAVVDVGFDDFRAPPDASGEGSRTGGQGIIRTNRPAFDFYSAWRVVVYARVRRGE